MTAAPDDNRAAAVGERRGARPLEQRPEVIFFDVNETLSDMSPMADRFAELGVPGHLATLWFATLLRDGFALTAAGRSRPFATVAAEALRVAFATAAPNRPVDEAVEHVMSSFAQLPLHADVVDGVHALSALDVTLATLSNGSADVARQLLTSAGINDKFSSLLSVEDTRAWKPAAIAYAHGLEQCAVAKNAALLVAAHPWDIHGARRAGLRAAWINRSGAYYPSQMRSPDIEATSVVDLAEQVERLTPRPASRATGRSAGGAGRRKPR